MEEQVETNKKNTYERHVEVMKQIADYCANLHGPKSLGDIERETGIATQTLSKNLRIMYYEKKLPEHLEVKKVGNMIMIFPKSIQ